MDICYHKSLLGYNLTKIPNDELYSVLPQGIYTVTVQKNMNGFEYYFTPQKDFHIPDYVVSDLAFIERVRNVYIKSGKQLGILLHGLSGMGKSMLAKQLCMEMVTKCQMPVIIFDFNSAEHIADILKQVNQPSVIFLDEFEKMFAGNDVESKPYQEQNELLSILDGTNVSKHIFLFTANEKSERQNYLLTLLDGVMNHKHLFLFTCNDVNKINPYMLHRPSRIRYHFRFDRVPKEIAHEIIERDYIPVDNSNVAVLKLLTDMIDGLSYDMLFECIKECNLYPTEDPMELVTDLALEISDISLEDYDVVLKLGDKTFDVEDLEEVLGERTIGNVKYSISLDEDNVKRNINVNGLNDTIVRNNWMFFLLRAEGEVDGDLREDSTDAGFQLKLKNPLAYSLLKGEMDGTVDVTGFNNNVYGWVKVDSLEKLLEVFPELNEIKFSYRKKS